MAMHETNDGDESALSRFESAARDCARRADHKLWSSIIMSSRSGTGGGSGGWRSDCQEALPRLGVSLCPPREACELCAPPSNASSRFERRSRSSFSRMVDDD